MPSAPIESYSAQVLTFPPAVRMFPAGPEVAALVTARSWVEDQAREYLVEHSLPHNPWEAGVIFAVGFDQGPFEKVLAELVIHTEEGEYIFAWNDAG